jgi:electron transport complex protein RnfB
VILAIGTMPLLAFEWAFVWTAVIILALLAVLFGIALAVVSDVFRVRTDPRVEQVLEALPGINCGACGFPGCSGYAEAVAAGRIGPDECVPGGGAVAAAVAGIMGLSFSEKTPRKAIVHCRGSAAAVGERYEYDGIRDCRAAALASVQSGAKQCMYGCLGYGTCATVCPFGAIEMGPDGLPHVDEQLCTGCGACVAACPRRIISTQPVDKHVHVYCSSKDKGPVVRKICSVGCIGCKKCEKVCPVEGSAIHVNDFLAAVEYAKCISCGKCARECPVSCIGNLRAGRKKLQQAAEAAAGV